MSSLADELSPAGWPRPWLLWTPPPDGIRSHAMPRILPVPWVNGAHPYRGDWVTFDEERATHAHRQRLCGVCGQPLNQVALLGRRDNGSAAGPASHPRCMELTLTACPQFTDPPDSAAAVVWRVDGPRLGYLTVDGGHHPYEGAQPVEAGLRELGAREVEALARIDPWGTERPSTLDADDTVADG